MISNKSVDRFTSVFLLFALSAFLCTIASSVHAVEMDEYQTVKLQSLNKVTARTNTFEVAVGSTVQYGSIFIKARTCRKAPPIEQPESAAFLQIWQKDVDDKPEWIFSGWMFASSPALSAMDHPIYDVWVLDCLNKVSEGTNEGDDESQNSRNNKAPASDEEVLP